jgi:tRNA(fMet)-specific endonuclease VapC
MIVLDTDTFTFLWANHPRVAVRADEATAGGEVVAITIVTKAEVLRGRFDALLKAENPERFLSAQQQLALSEQLLDAMPVLFLNADALAHFERIKGMKGVKKIGRPDLLIGCIALAHDATLVTRNLRHFRLIPGLRLDNWVD